VLVWRNGERYEGEFSDGQRHGFGVHRFATGDDINRSGPILYIYVCTYVNRSGTIEIIYVEVE
jgi:hypothetical protein